VSRLKTLSTACIDSEEVVGYGRVAVCGRVAVYGRVVYGRVVGYGRVSVYGGLLAYHLLVGHISSGGISHSVLLCIVGAREKPRWLRSLRSNGSHVLRNYLVA
jgi:hypothetical protein